LEQIFSFSVKSKETDCELDESDIVLLGSNRREILILVKSKKLVKKIDRLNGRSSGTIDLGKKFNMNTQSQNLSFQKMDLECKHFLLKDTNRASLSVFDENFNFLFEIENYQFLFDKFKTVDFTSNNDFYYCDNLNKKVYFV
ncbi:unnamed protein product, partial [Brachionus calyciflorus]